MNVSTLAPYAKAVVAIAGAIVATSCLADGNLSLNDVTVIAAAWATVLGVHQVPNKAK